MGVIEKDLRELATHYKCRLLFWVISLSLLSLALLALLISLVSSSLNFTESSTSLVYLVSLISAPVFGFYLFYLLSKKIRNLKEVALLVERVYPDLNESCIKHYIYDNLKYKTKVNKALKDPLHCVLVKGNNSTFTLPHCE